MVDYSRFDGIVDSEDEDAPREEQPVRPRRGPSQLPSPSSGGGAPTDIIDDLNDYFSRLEARRQEQIDAGLRAQATEYAQAATGVVPVDEPVADAAETAAESGAGAEAAADPASIVAIVDASTPTPPAS